MNEELEILGEPRYGVTWMAAVVTQGQLGRMTPISINKFLGEGDILVIVSTTHLKDRYSFTDSEQRAIDEGRLVFIFIPVPDPEMYPSFWKTNHVNKNMQSLTSYHGINYAHRYGIEYCLKIRHDLLITRPN